MFIYRKDLKGFIWLVLAFILALGIGVSGYVYGCETDDECENPTTITRGQI